MKTFDISRTQYKVSDFLSWQKAGYLKLSPSFQRRSVWKKGAKSYLIDTMLRGLPIPILFIRERRTDLSSFEPIREVVDGQQRIRTVISFIAPGYLKDLNENRDIFSILRSHNQELAGKKFEDLSPDLQSRILDYKFSVHVLPPGMDDREVLQIFARMNSTGTKLNHQELRNAEYFGEFKTSMYEMALKHLNRWRSWKIFTEDNISRMAEVEFVSDIVSYFLFGLTAKKQKNVDKMYEERDENFPERKNVEKRFDVVMDSIDDYLGQDLQFMPFKNKTLFYGLFITCYNIIFGGEEITKYKKAEPISKRQISACKKVSEDIEKKSVPQTFIEATTKRTTDLSSRKILIKHLKEKIENA